MEVLEDEEENECVDEDEEELNGSHDNAVLSNLPFIPYGIGPLPFQLQGNSTGTGNSTNSNEQLPFPLVSSVPYYLLPKGYVNPTHFISPPLLASYSGKPRIDERRIGESSNRFALLQEPNEIQRKSYKNENRCLLPNPLIISTKDRDPRRLPRITEGTATVKLVNGEGVDLSAAVEQSLVSHDHTLTKPLDQHLSASFSLKLQCTSEGNHFRLLFQVQYTTEDGEKHEEKILSLPFVVYSNRKKLTTRVVPENYPVVLDMKPPHGVVNQETEIWIKGKGFIDPVSVMIGDKPASVLEAYDNLIVAMAPTRYDLLSDTTVQVQVANKNGRDLLAADNKLNFVYYMHPPNPYHVSLPSLMVDQQQQQGNTEQRMVVK